MPTQVEYLKYAETAFASYAANLTLGRGVNADAYRVLADMAPSQALRFDSNWQVLGQQDLSDGFSATLFQEVDISGLPVGQKVMAIRGSESSHWGVDYLADVVNISIFGSEAGFSQYSSLEQFYQSLVATGKLGSQEIFVVTGHSLGGFLAQAFTAKHDMVSAAFTYNSPGFSAAGGLVSNIGTQVLKLFGLSGSIPNDKIFNVRALDGLSGAAGLGQMIGSVQTISIEAGSLLHNHSIVTLTDSLSLYSLYSQLDGQLSLADMDAVFRAASGRSSGSLEAGLDELRRILLGGQAVVANPTGMEDREAFYENLYLLAASDVFVARAGNVSVVSLAGFTETTLTTRAIDDIAYRYSLAELNAFAITGSADLYDQFNENDQLNLYDIQTGTGLTGQYLADRAAMLAWKILDYTADGSKVLLGDTPETYKYIDKTLKDPFGNDLTFTVRGRHIGSVGNPALITFGSNAPETLTGSDLSVGDSFYGAGGNDVLDGQGGDDYLEGGAGDDRLVGGVDDDDLNGGPGFDTYVYDEGDGFDAIADPGGEGRIVYKGDELSGGAKVAEGLYQDPAGVQFMLLDDGAGGQSLLIDGHLYVENFAEGALGIHLNGETSGPELPETATAHVYEYDFLPGDYDRGNGDPYGAVRNIYGSSVDDLFITDGEIEIEGRAGNDVAIFDAGFVFGNTFDMGAGDDAIDAGASDGFVNPAQLAGGSGNDYITGSAGADRIWGDIFSAKSSNSSNPNSGAGTKMFFVDAFTYNQSIPGSALVPPGYGSFNFVAGHGSFEGAGQAVFIPQGVMVAGSLEDALAAVLGASAAFDDFIDAGAGDDLVYGGSGSDEIHGGDGNDRLNGDYESAIADPVSYESLQIHFGSLATLFGRPGDDVIDGGRGNDVIRDTDGGSDILAGGEGDDTIFSSERLSTLEGGEAAHNVIHGDAGNDSIDLENTTGGFDVVDGGEGDDRIVVLGSALAIVNGGNGNDALNVSAEHAIVDGGPGNDEYVFGNGSYELADGAGDDTLRSFLFDLSPIDAAMDEFVFASAEGFDLQFDVTVGKDGDDLVATARDLFEGEQGAFSEVRIAHWFSGPGRQIENFIATRGAEDFVLSPAEYETWGGYHFAGDGDDEILDSSEYSDRAFGNGGDDLISTGDGADRIFGGTGDDVLVGGAGNDIYYYMPGNGNDVVEDSSGVDEIRFGPGISAADVAATLNETGLVLTVGQGRIEVSGGSRSAPGIEQVRFADGAVVAMAVLLPPLAVPVPEPPDPPASDPPQDHPSPHEQAGPGQNPVPDDPAIGGGGSNSGGGQAGEDVVQASPVESPVVAADSPPPVPAVATAPADIAATPVIPAEIVPPPIARPPIVPAAVEAVAPVRTSDASQSGVLAASQYSDPSLLFRGDPATPPFTSPESRNSEGARASADVPLDMQTMLDAVQAFDAGAPAAVPVGQSRLFSTAPQAERAAGSERTSGPELTSWALTNALLQFHLENVNGRDTSEGPADFSLGNPAFAAIGASLTHQGPGLEAFGSRTPALSTFSGLQEGFTRL